MSLCVRACVYALCALGVAPSLVCNAEGGFALCSWGGNTCASLTLHAMLPLCITLPDRLVTDAAPEEPVQAHTLYSEAGLSVRGSWDGWAAPVPLAASDHGVVRACVGAFEPGRTFQYRFVSDATYYYDPGGYLQHAAAGPVNNWVVVTQPTDVVLVPPPDHRDNAQFAASFTAWKVVPMAGPLSVSLTPGAPPVMLLSGAGESCPPSPALPTTGRYELKFIVDGNWVCSPDMPTSAAADLSVNNTVTVHASCAGLVNPDNRFHTAHALRLSLAASLAPAAARLRVLHVSACVLSLSLTRCRSVCRSLSACACACGAAGVS